MVRIQQNTIYEVFYLEIEEKKEFEELVKKVIEECYKEEGIINTGLIINITLTNPDNIRRINNEFRKIDKETDVLSFPMFQKEELKEIINRDKYDYEDILGDIIISIDRVKKQAEEYGHSFEREFCYMIVHGFYHLMGYDHIHDQDKIEMREKEEKILNNLNIRR